MILKKAEKAIIFEPVIKIKHPKYYKRLKKAAQESHLGK